MKTRVVWVMGVVLFAVPMTAWLVSPTLRKLGRVELAAGTNPAVAWALQEAWALPDSFEPGEPHERLSAKVAISAEEATVSLTCVGDLCGAGLVVTGRGKISRVGAERNEVGLEVAAADAVEKLAWACCWPE